MVVVVVDVVVVFVADSATTTCGEEHSNDDGEGSSSLSVDVEASTPSPPPLIPRFLDGEATCFSSIFCFRDQSRTAGCDDYVREQEEVSFLLSVESSDATTRRALFAFCFHFPGNIFLQSATSSL